MEDKPDKRVLIAGCGYIGQRVAVLLLSQRHAVTGLVRSAASAATLRTAGIDSLQLDLDAAAADSMPLRGHDRILYLAPPPRSGETDTRMQHFLAALAGSDTRRIVYISTSAVYGDCEGAWITEQHPLCPTTPRGHRRLDAELQVRNWARQYDREWTVLRVPGIYGPGKLPLQRLQQGLPVLRAADAPWTNRIHADDLAAICVAALQSPHCNTVYNVSDGHPGNMTDYFFRVADAAGLPRPPEVPMSEAHEVLSAGMLSFLQDSRRMRNDKVLKELEVTLQYPDLASGLPVCLE